MSKTISIMKNILIRNIRQWILLVVLSSSTILSAQGVLSGAQTGTVEEIRRSEGVLVISGRDHGFNFDVTQVFYDGEEVDSGFLNRGLVVRFTLNRDGVLARIEVLGPLNLIEALEES